MNNSQHIDEMVLALKANVEFLKENGSSRQKIKNGKFIYQAGEKYVYEFVVDYLQEIDSEAEIEVVIERSSTTGKIVALQEKSLQIELDSFVGEYVNEAWLIVSTYYLIKKLYEQLEAVKSGEIKPSGLGDKLFNISPQDNSVSIPDNRKVVESELNDEQTTALNSALSNEITYLWGPPGTGKTQTIASIVESYVNNDLSVLLLSHANKAVDEALLKTVEHMEAARNEHLEDGKILRFGEITHKELKQKYSDKVVPANIAERKAKDLKEEISKLRSEENSLLEELSTISDSISKLNNFQNSVKDLKKKEHYLNALKSEYHSYVQSSKDAKRVIDEHTQTLREFESKGTFGKFFSTQKPEQLKQWIHTARENRIKYNNAVEKIRATIETGLHELENLKKEVVANENACKGLNEESLRSKSKSITDRQAEISDEVRDIEEQISAITELLFRDATLIATTLTKSYLSNSILSRAYDCVIVDEVSMAPLPATWFAASLAKSRVVVVGDFFQLPPVVKHEPIKKKGRTQEDFDSENELVDKWLRKDIFDLTGITSAVQKGKPIPVEGFVQLRKQYRMDDIIAQLVNKIVYGKYDKKYALVTKKKVTKEQIELVDKEPAPSQRLSVYSTTSLQTYDSKTDSNSIYNLQQALICVKLASSAIDSGYEKAGIVTGYRAQADLMQKIVADVGLDKVVTAETVHRFQGGQQPVVIFDITTPKSPSIYDDTKELGNDEKLINVALSRTQEKCVIVGDVEAIRKKHSNSSTIRTCLDYIDENRFEVFDAENVMSAYEAETDIDKWLEKIERLENPGTNAIYDDSNFYQGFLHDISKAESEIIIDSPFLTVSRIEKLLPYISRAIARGVKVFVITRKVSDQTGNMKSQAEESITALDEAGVTVITFGGKIHEKIAIIDRNILWHGSLNIMSQNTSKESMFRFTGENVVKQLLHSIGFEKNVGKLGENKLEKCVYCTEATAWYWTGKSRFGMWTYCMANYHAKDKPPKTKTEIEAVAKKKKALASKKKEYIDGVPQCPEHEVSMVRKPGRFGDFWGCPYYKSKNCRVTENIK